MKSKRENITVIMKETCGRRYAIAHSICQNGRFIQGVLVGLKGRIFIYTTIVNSRFDVVYSIFIIHCELEYGRRIPILNREN